jgi:DNA-directed RNA polymerase subunit RPC12/RpoP
VLLRLAALCHTFNERQRACTDCGSRRIATGKTAYNSTGFQESKFGQSFSSSHRNLKQGKASK